MTPSISFLIATIGRPTLKDTILSLKDQIILGHDHIYCVFDGKCETLDLFEETMFFGDSLRLILHPKNLGSYGHGLRNFYQSRLEGNYIHHMDDDDTYMPGAIPQIRNEIESHPGKIIIGVFRNHVGRMVGDKQLIQTGEVGTPNAFWPNKPQCFSEWPLWYGGDGEFYKQTVTKFGGEQAIVWTSIEIIQVMRASGL